MRVYNAQNHEGLSPGLAKTLASLRARRGFDAGACILAKATLLNDYMRKHGLGGCVVGVSGGVDSALVFALVVTASRIAGSPIRRVMPLLMPIHSSGATNQDVATARGREVLAAFGFAPGEADLTKAFDALQEPVDAGAKIKGGDWAGGQLASYLRTPALYYASSLLAQEGCPALVIGTTNRDEGSYLGFFGKASDAAVDLQLISDLHKSEVYAAAQKLSVPQSILDAAPTGDMYDARLDEEVFGAPYDFVELLLAMKCIDAAHMQQVTASWSAADKAQFEKFSANLEKLHSYNAHKYIVGSPAVHLDIYHSTVPGGWQHGPRTKPWAENVDRANFVAPFDLSGTLLDKLETGARNGNTTVRTSPLPGGETIFLAENLLERAEVSSLLKEVRGQTWLPADVHGMRRDFDPARDKVGSWRASSYCTRLSYVLWQRLHGLVPTLENIPSGTSLDAKDCVLWRAVGVSPLFRLIKYTADGILVPHYDAPFDFGDGRRTLKSMIVYLTDASASGDATRFIKDPQQEVPPLTRKYDDWNRLAKPDEILLSLSPAAGTAIILNHRVLHDSAPTGKGAPDKIVMRADIVYEKILAP